MIKLWNKDISGGTRFSFYLVTYIEAGHQSAWKCSINIFVKRLEYLFSQQANDFN
jgi:hypothetical protein